VLAISGSAQYRTSVVAGGGPPDGVQATSVALGSVTGIAVDGLGNRYVASSSQHRVYKIAVNGTISTVAGNGIAGYSGDNGPATAAQLNSPRGVAVDSAGDLYIADSANSRIRKVSGGVITTFAGDGVAGFSGDSGPAVSARFNNPQGVAVTSTGTVYIADTLNYRIRRVASGVVTTIVGTGVPGYSEGLSGLATQIGHVTSLAVDNVGSLYFGDGGNARIRKVVRGVPLFADVFVVSTVAGNGVCKQSGDGGPATSAEVCGSVVAVDASGTNLYISDSGLRKITGGVITKVSDVGGAALALDSASDVYLATDSNSFFGGGSVVYKLAGGTLMHVGGNGTYQYSGDGGPATSAQVDPGPLAIDPSGNLYISQQNDNRIRRVVSGVITTFAGNGSYGFSGDGGLATSASLAHTRGIAVDGAGSLYIADSNNNRIRKVTSGIINTIAGTGFEGYSGDGGLATAARISALSSIAVDQQGVVYFADAFHNRVRKIANGVITTFAGAGPQSGVQATSVSIQGRGMASDAGGNAYVASPSHNRVYKIAPDGVLTTVAGDGTRGYSGDGGAATGAQLDNPMAVAVDSSGSIYIADSNNSRVRKVSGGIITTVAGGGGSFADGQPATSVELGPRA
jgi:sugar lactone lactonase YvrE